MGRGVHARSLSAEDLADVLTRHHDWLRTKGRSGAQADLSRVDLSGVDLSDGDLTLGRLSGAKLTGADLSGTSLRWADLSSTDLRGVVGLAPAQLAGADLVDAQLDPSVEEWSVLEYLKDASSRTQAIALSVVTACLYSALTILTTRDSGLVTNSPSSTLPIIQTPVPIVVFFWVTPLLLLAAHSALLMAVERQWDTAFALPWRFTDGTSPEQRANVFPMLRLRLWSPRLKRRARTSLPRLAAAGYTWLLWLIVPATLALFWLRYMSRHDWTVTMLHVVVLSIALGMATSAVRKAQNVVFEQLTRSPSRGRWKALVPTAVVTLAFVVLLQVSDAAIEGTPHYVELTPRPNTSSEISAKGSGGTRLAQNCRRITTPSLLIAVTAWVNCPSLSVRLQPGWVDVGTVKTEAAGARKWVPLALAAIGVIPYANLQQEDMSSRPIPWRFPGVGPAAEASAFGEFGMLKPVSIDNRDLRNANLRRTFLVEASLRGAHLSQANLSDAKLEDANLEGCHLDRADLSSANLHNANLKGATLTEAHLPKADLRGAKMEEAFADDAFMERIRLEDADVRRARFQRSTLVGARLVRATAERADFREANLGGAVLVGAILKDASLATANLTDAYLWCADLRGADLLEAGLGKTRMNLALIDARSRIHGTIAPELMRTTCRYDNGTIVGSAECEAQTRQNICECIENRVKEVAEIDDDTYEKCLPKAVTPSRTGVVRRSGR